MSRVCTYARYSATNRSTRRRVPFEISRGTVTSEAILDDQHRLHDRKSLMLWLDIVLDQDRGVGATQQGGLGDGKVL